MSIFKFLSRLFKKKIVIEADDSGFGSLYGGALIFITNGHQDFSAEVPLEAFNIMDKEDRKKRIMPK